MWNFVCMIREGIQLRSLCFFFFQAEDGIRDVAVTGVQTCALPIFLAALKADHTLDGKDASGKKKAAAQASAAASPNASATVSGDGLRVAVYNGTTVTRSEERRVGKEGRSRWWGAQ